MKRKFWSDGMKVVPDCCGIRMQCRNVGGYLKFLHCEKCHISIPYEAYDKKTEKEVELNWMPLYNSYKKVKR